MNPADIIAAINAIAALTPSLVQLVQASKDAFSSDDMAAINEAMANLRAQSDADFARVESELAGS